MYRQEDCVIIITKSDFTKKSLFESVFCYYSCEKMNKLKIKCDNFTETPSINLIKI